MASKVDASHILVKTEAEANVVLYDVTHGKSFEEVAKAKSLCPSGKKGGGLGWFTRNQMVKEFENAAFSSKNAQNFSLAFFERAQKSTLFLWTKVQSVRLLISDTLKKGEISKPVKTQFGYHIIKVNDIA